MKYFHVIGRDEQGQPISYDVDIESEEKVIDDYIIPFITGKTILLDNDHPLSEDNKNTLQVYESQQPVRDCFYQKNLNRNQLEEDELKENLENVIRFTMNKAIFHEITNKVRQKAVNKFCTR